MRIQMGPLRRKRGIRRSTPWRNASAAQSWTKTDPNNPDSDGDSCQMVGRLAINVHGVEIIVELIHKMGPMR